MQSLTQFKAVERAAFVLVMSPECILNINTHMRAHAVQLK